MKIDTAYIISWFGDESIRDKRKQGHEKQVKWALSQGLKIKIFAQNYRDDEYIRDKDVSYIKHSGRVLSPSEARNALLKEFYRTDEDFGVFADNDAILYDRGDSNKFIDLLRSRDSNEFEGVGIIVPLDPARKAFSRNIERDEYKNYLSLHRTAKVKGSFMMIRNNKANHLFDETFARDREGKLIPNEDTDFALTLWRNGLGSYETPHMILNELCRSDSTWVAVDSDRSKMYFDVVVPKLLKKHGDIYKFGDKSSCNLIKEYNYWGWSYHENRGKILRFARDKKKRTKVLERCEHSDIYFEALPSPMQIDDILEYLSKTQRDPTVIDMVNTEKEHRNRISKRVAKLNRNKDKTSVIVKWNKLNVGKLPTRIQLEK